MFSMQFCVLLGSLAGQLVFGSLRYLGCVTVHWQSVKQPSSLFVMPLQTRKSTDSDVLIRRTANLRL